MKLALVFACCAGLWPASAAAHHEGGDLLAGHGPIAGLGDFKRVGKTTYRFLPAREEYEVRAPDQPTSFMHADDLSLTRGEISASEPEEVEDPLLEEEGETTYELAPICRTAGRRIVVIYTHRPGDETPTPTETLRERVRWANWKIAHYSSLSSEGSRVVRMAVDCDAEGKISVYSVATATNYTPTIDSEVAKQLFGKPEGDNAVRYWVFDSEKYPGEKGIAGLAQLINDATKGSSNLTANHTLYAHIFFAWKYKNNVHLHELFHTLGATQSHATPTAPYSSFPQHHCVDGLDVMCYQDSGSFEGKLYSTTRCPASEGYGTNLGKPIDCGEDTYFDADPEPGSWLDEYWNVAGPEDPFLIAPPKAATEAASEVGPHGAGLHGTVNPEGYDVSYRFEYGPTAEYGSSTPGEEIEYGDTEIAVSEAIEGLRPGTPYHFRVVAESDAGVAYGEDETFTTGPPPTTLCKSSSESSSCALANSYPAETALEASTTSFILETSAGTVSCSESALSAKSKEQTGEPLGLSLTAWSLAKCLLGKTSCTVTVTNLPSSATLAWSEGSSGALLIPSGGTGQPRLSVKCGFLTNCSWALPGATLKGGSPASVVLAEGKLAQSSGFCPATNTQKAATYTLNSPKPLYVARETTASPPKGKTEEATNVGADHATLNGSVNPEGSSTSYYFEYGETTAYGSKAPASPKAAGSGTSYVKVAETLEGLKAGATYHFRLVAESEGGTAQGEDLSFATASDKRFDFAFGSKGTGNGQLANPYGVATDSSGNAWVTDTQNNRVQKFNAKGEYVSQFGSTGSGNGQFSVPTGIAIDSSGNVWVSDCGNDRVQKFNAKGEYVSQFGSEGTGNGQLYCPMGLAFNSSGLLFVVDNGNNRVQKFKANGEYVSQFGAKGTGNGAFESPQGIAFDTKGRIWVTDTGNNRLQRFDGATLAYLNQFGSKGTGNGQLETPTAIAVDLGGGLWVVDSHNHRVQRFSEGGTYLDQIGAPGTGAGQMSVPNGIAVPADWQLLVVDSSNNRVQHWTQVPEAPSAATEAATSITSTSATLNAKINPYTLATTYRFEYDTVAYKDGESPHGTKIPVPDESIGSGDKDVSVAKAITGLKSKTKYYFRVVAANASGTTLASQKTFTTP